MQKVEGTVGSLRRAMKIGRGVRANWGSFDEATSPRTPLFLRIKDRGADRRFNYLSGVQPGSGIAKEARERAKGSF